MVVRDFAVREGKRDALLVNPFVYDISDFKLEYCQPIGLLKIGSLLRKAGARVHLIDCLEDIGRREISYFVRRDDKLIPVYHFGLSSDEFEQKLRDLSAPPQEIYLTAFATYWYKSVGDAISIIRKIFPKAKIIVGGIYPTLMPEHAEINLGADVVAVGEVKGANAEFPLTDLYESPKYAGIKPSRGCPHNCGYCAQRVINSSKMVYADPLSVADEMQNHYESKGISQFYVFSENFLYRQEHFLSLLNEIIRRKLPIRIGAPKGMEPRLLNTKLLALMKEAGWVGIRLALETASENHRRMLGRNHNNIDDYERAVHLAREAGFSASEIGTFLLYGTPGEKLEDIYFTAEYIQSRSSYIIPMAFTPVPGSKIFSQHQNLLAKSDLTDLMGRLYPFAEFNGYSFDEYLQIEEAIAGYNKKSVAQNNLALDLDELVLSNVGAFSRSEFAFAMNL